MRKSPARTRQRGSHFYPRRLPSGQIVFYAYISGAPRPRVTLDTSDPVEAERRFRAKLADPAADVRIAAPPEVALAQIAVTYLDAPHGWTRQTMRTARNRVLAVGAWFERAGIVYASEIAPAIVDDWVRERRKVRTHRTFNRDLRSFKLMLAWGMERGMCGPCLPISERAYLREAKRQNRHIVPDPDEMRLILATIAARFQAAHEEAKKRSLASAGGRWPRAGAREAIAAIYATGLRIDELRRLGEDDLWGGRLHARPEKGAADVAEPGKGYRERAIPLAPEAEAAVREFFRWTKGRKRTFSESWLIGRLHDTTDAIGIPRCGLHDIRRGFATEMVRGGVDTMVVSRWLGHADIRTTEVYLAEYRSDAMVEAPVPRGLRVQSVSNTGAHEGESLPILASAAVETPSGNNAETKAESGSYPCDLNARPAVYETVGRSLNHGGSRHLVLIVSNGAALRRDATLWDWADLALAAEGSP